MSWAGDEWKDGLNHKALGKIAEIEKQNEILKKETKQKQFLMESLEASSNKQKRKVEEDKIEISALKRENHSLAEDCTKLQQRVDKLSNELKHKEVHISGLEGQYQRCKYQLEQYSCKTPKQGKSVEEEARDFSSKIGELQSLLDQEKAKTRTLEKEINDAKNSQSARRQSFMTPLPWATDEPLVTPVKPQRPLFDLLTGSPVSVNGSGDSNPPLLFPTSNNQPTPTILPLPLVAPPSNDSDLQQKLTSLEKELAIKSEEISALHQKLKESADKVSVAEDKLQQLASEVTSDREKHQVTMEDLKSKQEDGRKRKEKEWEEERRKWEEQLVEQKNKFNETLSEAKRDLKEIQTELDQTNLNRNKLDSELKKSSHKLLQMEQLHQSDQSKLKQLQTSEQVLMKENDSLSCQLEKMSSKLESMETQRDSLKSENQRLHQSVSDKKLELEKCNAEIKADRVKFEKETSKLEAELDKLRVEFDEVEKQKNQQKDRLTQKEEEVTKLRSQVSYIENNTNGTINKLEERSNEVEALTKENNMLLEQSEAVVGELKKTKCDLEKLRERYEVKVTEVVEQHQDEVEGLKTKIKNLKKNSQEEVRRLMLGAEEEMRTLSGRLKDQEGHLHQLNAMCDEKQRILDGYKNKLDEQVACAEAAKEEHFVLKEEYKKLCEQEGGVKDQVCRLENQLKSHLSKVQEISGSKAKLMEEHKVLVQEARAEAIERRSLEGRVQDLEAQVVGMQRALDAAEDDVRSFEDVKKKEEIAREELDNLKMRMVGEASRMKGLEEEVLMLRSNIEITAKEKDENASELSELTNSIQIKVTKYENSLDVKEKQIQGLETSLKEVQMERNYLNQELVALKVNHQNELQKHDVTSALVEQLKLNCQQKETEVAKKSQNLEELETQVLELNEKLISHQSEGLRLVSANQKLQNQVANHSAVVESLQQGVCKLEKDKLTLVEEMANLKLTSDSVVLSLQEEAENTQSKAREQEVLLKTRMEEVEASREKNRVLGSELENVGKLFEESKLQVESHERHAKELERLVENMKQVMAEKQDEYEEVLVGMRLKCEDAEDRLGVSQSEVESLKLSLEDVMSEKCKAVDLAQHTEESLKAVEQEVVKLTEEVVKLQQMFDDKINELNEKEEQLEQVKNSTEFLEQSVLLKESESGRISQEFDEYRERNELLVESLNKEKDNLNSKVTALQSDLDKSNNVISSLNSTCQSLEVRLETLEHDLAKSVGNAELLEMDMESKDEILLKVEEKLSHAEDSLCQKESSLKDKEIELMKLEEEFKGKMGLVDELKSKNEFIGLKLKQCYSDLEIKEIQLNEADLKLEETGKSNCGLLEELQKVQALYQDVVLVKQQMETDLQDVKSKMEQQIQVVDSLQESLEESRSENKKLVLELDSNVLKMSGHEEELDGLKSVVKETQIQSQQMGEALKKEKISLEKECEKSRDDLEVLKVKFEALVKRKEKIEVGLEDSRAQNENLEILCNRYMEDNASLREEVKRMNSDLEKSSKALVDLEMQFNDVEWKLEDVEVKNRDVVEKMTREVEVYKEERNNMEGELKALQCVLETKEERGYNTKTEELMDQIDNLKISNEKVFKDLDQKILETEEALAEVQELKILNESLEEKLVKSTEDLALVDQQYKEQVQVLEGRLEDAEDEMKMLKEEAENGNHQLDCQVQRGLDLEAEILVLKTKQDDLLLKIGEKEEVLLRLSDKNKNLNAERINLQKDYKDLQMKLEVSSQECYVLREKVDHEIEKHEAHVSELEQRVVGLEEVKSSLEDKVEELVEQLEGLGNQMRKMEADNKGLMEEVKRSQDVVAMKDIKLHDMEYKYQQLEVNLKDKETQFAESMATLEANMLQDNVDHQHKVEELYLKVGTLEDMNTRHDETIEGYVQRLDEFKSTVAELEIVNQRLQDDLESKSLNISHLEEDICNLKEKEEKLLREIEEKGNLESLFDERLMQGKSEVEGLKEELCQSLQRSMKLENFCSDLRKAAEETEKEKDLKLESLEQEIECLRKSVETSENDYEEKLSLKIQEFDSVKEKCREVTWELESVKRQNVELLEQCVAGKERVCHLEEKIELKENEVSVKSEDLEKIKLELCFELEKNTNYSEETRKLENEVKSLQSHAMELQSQHKSTLNGYCEKLRVTEETNKVLEEDISVAKLKLETYFAALEDKTMKISELERNIECLELKLRETVEVLNETKLKLGSVESENSTLKYGIENSESGLKTRVSELEATLVEREMYGEHMKKENVKLKDVLSLNEQKLQDSLVEERRLKCEIKTLEKDKESLKQHSISMETKITELKQQLSVAITTIDKLQAEQRLHVDAVTLAEKENKEVRSELESTIHKLKDDLEKSSLKISNEEMEVEQLRRKLEDSNLKLQHLNHDYDVINVDYEALKGQSQDAGNAIEEKSVLEEKLLEMRKEFDSKVKENDEISGENFKLENEVSMLRENITEAQSHHDSMVCGLKEDNLGLVGKVGVLESEVDRLKREGATVVEQLEGEVDRLKREDAIVVEQLEGDVDRLKREDAIVVEQLESEVDRLKREDAIVVEQLESEVDRLKREGATMKEELEGKHNEVANLMKQLESTELQASTLSAMVAELEAARDVHVGEYKQLDDQLTKVRSDFKTEVATLEERNKSLEQKLEASSDDMRVKDEYIVCEKREAEELRARLSVAVANIEELEGFKGQFSEIENRHKNLVSEYECMEVELLRVGGENDDLMVDVGRLKEVVEEREGEVKGMREKLHLLENVVSEAETSNSQMSTELRKLNEAIQRESSISKRRISSMEDENEDLRREVGVLQLEVDGMKKEEQGAKDAMMMSEDRIRLLEDEVVILEREKQKLEDANDKLKDDHSRLQLDVAQLRVDLEDAGSSLQRMGEDKDGLILQVERLTNNLLESSHNLHELQLVLDDQKLKIEDNEQTNIVTMLDLQTTNAGLTRKVCDVTEKLIQAEQREQNFESRFSELEARSLKRDIELDEASKKAVVDFNLMRKEVEVLEANNVKLTEEIENLKINEVLSDSKLESALESLMHAREELNREVTRNEELKKQVEGLQSRCNDSVVKQLTEEKLKLEKEVEKITGKLKLMTLTARRKEKELIQFQHSFKPPVHSTDKSHDSESSQSGHSKVVRRKSPRKSGGKSLRMLVHNDSESTLAPCVSEGTSGSASPVYQLEGLPHLVKKGFADIPQGFSSPHVMRRQNLTKTKVLVAEALASKKQPSHAQETRIKKEKSPSKPQKLHLGSKLIKKEKKLEKSPSSSLLEAPTLLQNITNSPKQSPSSLLPPSGRQTARALSLNSADEVHSSQHSVDNCKTQ